MTASTKSRTNIILIGFMGAGKSTVGKIVAERTGREFVDIDAKIEEEAEMTISAIFSKEEEAGFRRREQAMITKVTSEGGRVIACGGGAVTVPANVRALRSSGLVIYLTTTPEMIFERVKHEVSGRPLIASGDPFRVINKLIGEREGLYIGAAHKTIDTTGLTPDEVADSVIETAGTGPGIIGHGKAGYEINVAIPSVAASSYPIIIRQGLLERVGERIEPFAAGRVFLITDKDVHRLYGEIVETSIKKTCGSCETIVIPSGEGSKDWRQVAEVQRRLIELGAERGDLVAALGGGVVGDLSGFVAATYQRGIPVIQIPTSLLAQVDSSIGGKTGINIDGLKNMVGAFHQPRAVLIDPEVVSTLPKDEFLCGLAEIIKAGFLDGGHLLEVLESSVERILQPGKQTASGRETFSPDIALLSEVISLSCVFKAQVVEADEREAELRQILNYGHTLAHALEAISTVDWRHGHAVAVGMVFAARLGLRLGIGDQKFVERQLVLIERCGLPVSLPEVDTSDILRAMRSDKKRSKGAINFVFLEAPGRPVIRAVSEDDIAEELTRIVGS